MLRAALSVSSLEGLEGHLLTILNLQSNAHLALILTSELLFPSNRIQYLFHIINKRTYLDVILYSTIIGNMNTLAIRVSHPKFYP